MLHTMKTRPKTFLQQIDKIIQQHLAQKDLLRILEKLLALSSSQVYRKIKRQTGFSPSVYIRQQRLKRAHQLILESDWAISDIAKLVGFRQLAYFSRCFAGFYGVAPSVLRRGE